MGFKFPYGNQQQLNLDWFIRKFKELVAAWNEKEESIDGALDAEIQRAEDALTDVYTARDVAVAAKNDAVDAKNDAVSAKNDAVTAKVAAETAKSYANIDALRSEGWAVGEQNATPVASDSPYYENNAKYYKQQADADATATAADRVQTGLDKTATAADALKAEGYASGTQNGTPVASDSPYYQNNGAYYKQKAEDAADAADTLKDNANAAALRAEGWADGTQYGTPVTSESPYYENNAKYYKEAAEDVLNSIPADYSELAAEVASQSEKIDELKTATTKIGAKFADYFPSNDPALIFNTTNHTVKLSAGYMILDNSNRITVNEQTIDYYPVPSPTVSSLLFVYDSSTSTFKGVYAYNTTNGYDPTKQFIIASFTLTSIAKGVITTPYSYTVDNKYYRNTVEEFTENPTTIKVCTYNMGMYNYGINTDPEDIPAVLAKCNNFFNSHPFDILALQENKQALSTYNVETAIYDNWYKNSYGYDRWAWIETIFNLKDTHPGAFSSAVQGDGRIYVYGTVTVDDKELFVVVIHMAINTTDRATNYTELFTLCSGHDNVIVLGDFNAGTDGGNPQTEFDQITQAGYKMANGGVLGLLATTEGGTYTDNIMVSSNIYIRKIEVLDVYDSMCSDHLPLTAELVVY